MRIGRFTTIRFWNFDNSTQFLSYIYQDKKLVEKKFCSNIAPSTGTGQKNSSYFQPAKFQFFLYGTAIFVNGAITALGVGVVLAPWEAFFRIFVSELWLFSRGDPSDAAKSLSPTPIWATV